MKLVNFSKELEAYKDELGYNQLWRYKTGRLPKLVLWIAQRPDLAEALARDARALQVQSSIAPRGGRE